MSHPFWIEKLVPPVFREFIPYVSPSALQVIHVNQVLKQALYVTENYLSKKYLEKAKTAFVEDQKRLGILSNLSLTESMQKPIVLQNLNKAERTLVGETIVTLYFYSVLIGPFYYLDLKLKNFSWDKENQKIQFAPSPLLFKPSAELKTKITLIYQGYFDRISAKVDEGITLYYWQCTPSDGYPERIKKLLDLHFNIEGTSHYRFGMKHFRSSFHALFEEARVSHAKIHPDLTFLGTMLASLYLSLSELDVEIDLEKCFRSIEKEIQKK